MIILGLDSSAKTAGVAIAECSGDTAQLLYEGWLGTGFTHSETLLELVDSALRACRLDVGAVELYALTAGPGSFTGLRIGMSLVKGLAAPGNVPCVPVSTLKALAAGCDAPGLLVPAMDARRNEVYTAVFLLDAAGLHRLTDDSALPAAAAAQTAADLAAAHGVGVTVLGDGAHLVTKAWPAACPAPWLADPVRRTRAAAAAALLGAAAAATGDTLPAADLRPDYHRLCQAERERNEKLAAMRGA